jgi:hypothetical protein
VSGRVRIEGGPADGLEVAPGAKFAWLEVVVRRRAERTPGAGLYELRDGGYVYVGAGARVCSCGTVLRGGACPLCGAGRGGEDSGAMSRPQDGR